MLFQRSTWSNAFVSYCKQLGSRWMTLGPIVKSWKSQCWDLVLCIDVLFHWHYATSFAQPDHLPRKLPRESLWWTLLLRDSKIFHPFELGARPLSAKDARRQIWQIAHQIDICRITCEKYWESRWHMNETCWYIFQHSLFAVLVQVCHQLPTLRLLAPAPVTRLDLVVPKESNSRFLATLFYV